MDNNNTGNSQGTPAQQGNNTEGGAQGGERLFTQEEVNNLINKRFGELMSKVENYDALKEKAEKYDEAQEASKTELQKASDQRDAYKKELDELKKANQVREIRRKVAEEKKVPESLLTAETEEACQKQADDILAFANPEGYPVVVDNGEVHHESKRATRDQFADFLNQKI